MELGVRVVGAVLVVDSCDFGKVLGFGAVFLHVFPSGVAEHLCCSRGVGHASGCLHHLPCRPCWVCAIFEEGLERAGEHLFKAHYHHAVCGTVRHSLACHVKACRAGRAVVVDVVYGDGSHAELVENALAAGGVAIAIACYALVDIVVIDLGVKEGFDTGLCNDFSISRIVRGLHERLESKQHSSRFWVKLDSNWTATHTSKPSSV